jgi:hypothetical protein
MTHTAILADDGTQTNHCFLAALAVLESRVGDAEAASRRNGWTEGPSVYPVRFTDDLLDLRLALAGNELVELVEVIDVALRNHGGRPGVTTTDEVRTLCDTIHALLLRDVR